MTKALIVVDVQNDFCEGGALAVAGGNDVARSIATYLDDKGSGYDLVVATRDWHDAIGDNAGHFANEPDFVDSWPSHCVAGTDGVAFHSDLWPIGGRFPHLEVRKGQGVPAYSGFEGTDADGTPLNSLLKNANVTDVDVVGLAFDYCVKATAIDAAREGFNTKVLKSLTAAIHEDGSTESELRAAGVVVVDNGNNYKDQSGSI